MSAPESVRAGRPLSAARAAAPDGGAYGTIVVVGGGCYGGYYLRQLERARAHGALAWERLLVVDRTPGCQAARDGLVSLDPGADPRLVVADWGDFFADWLGERAARPGVARDAIVPSPLMPHLMFDWLLARARARWPGRTIERRPLPAPPDTPWERAAPDGTHYASFATWMCPVNCVEPARCPHTRGPRDWSMPAALAAWVERQRAGGRAVAGPAVLHCAHRAFGVGMFDVREVLDADALVARAGTAGRAEVLVGTVSHCHGALALLAIGEAAGR